MRRNITFTFTWHILIAGFLILLALLSVLLFGGYKLYQKVLATEAAQREIVAAQEQEQKLRDEEAKSLLLSQQMELTEAKMELEKTKSEAKQTEAKIQTLTRSIEDQSRVEQQIVISSQDLSLYVTGVVQVICSGTSGISSGSGSLFTFKELKQAVLTNRHVVDGASRCVVLMTDTANSTTGMFALDPTVYTYNESTDSAILGLGKSLLSTNVPVQNYNYSLATLKRCSSLIPVGTPVVIVGFPAYAKRDAIISVETIGKVNSVYRTATNGIISGYDTSVKGEANYFVSAKIDNGNSGGVALAKDKSGLCMLGLPTWLTVGNYETQGLVQNIFNLLPKE